MSRLTARSKYHPALESFERNHGLEFDFYTVDSFDRAIPVGVYGTIVDSDPLEAIMDPELKNLWNKHLVETEYTEEGDYETRE